MEVREALSEGEVRATHPVMSQLRTHLSEDEYVSAVERMRGEGYRIAAAYDEGGRILGVAGFRLFETLYAGRVLCVDDLVSAEDARSGGVGAAMMRWLEEEAKKSGCDALQLDSGTWRGRAHRFYFREGMGIVSFHFAKEL